MATIKEECEKRNIDRLLHFTPVDHLGSILKHGLLVPSACKANNVGMKPNDASRHDGQDAICLSVEWPNWKLYWRFHLQDEKRPWALIQVRHSVLWEKRVCFNTTNAADNSMSSQTFAARQGVNKFLELFDDWGNKKRADLHISDHLPTNYQAEVLCLDTIEPRYFDAIYLDKQDAYNAYKGAHGAIELNDFYFRPRRDWRHW
ncbi:DarT ssDNA thymidine ADP-ribosyltransferase family protein [Variovorax sp. LjRoot290]|uniref:DarT ssDNA thymidine ADP-ribosyltransferase family protein n=1 Tax=Variovorax sp. LjRoot290 TaxID=3342316 RepID=UPI003ECCE24C